MSNCSKCKVCTKHRFDLPTKTWVRCENANQVVFLDDVSFLPKAYLTSSFESFDSSTPNRQAAVRVARLLVEKISIGGFPKKTLIFSSKDITLPTELGTIILKNLLKVKKCSITTLSELTFQYFDKKEEYFKSFIPDVSMVDIGSEIANASSLPIISEVYNARLVNNKYTFFTSRIPLCDFVTKFSKDLFSFFSSDKFQEYKL